MSTVRDFGIQTPFNETEYDKWRQVPCVLIGKERIMKPLWRENA